ncbi:MAG: hypothetical protein KAH77_01405 [Thiomargarita sp.]|nr:hypothetical protein [Thiomargarita sp.]
MPTKYTQYIEKLDIKKFPPQEMFEHLKQDLRSVLKKRGLWNAPPKYLGYLYFESWVKADPRNPDPLHDIAVDCYFFICTRISSLRKQLKIKENIDGLISLDIAHFITERQQKPDPEGYAIGSNVKKTISHLIEVGKIQCVGKLNKNTILTFSNTNTIEPSDKQDLWDNIRKKKNWCNVRLGLLSKNEKAQETAQDELSEILEQLPNADIMSFRYYDLLTCLKNDARNNRKIYYDSVLNIDNTSVSYNDDDEATQVLINFPDKNYEDWQDYKDLSDKTCKKILESKHKNAKKIHAVFQEYVASCDIDEDISQKEIALNLGLAAQTVNDYIKVIRKFMREVKSDNLK